jgi:hypothetical protein
MGDLGALVDGVAAADVEVNQIGKKLADEADADLGLVAAIFFSGSNSDESDVNKDNGNGGITGNGSIESGKVFANGVLGGGAASSFSIMISPSAFSELTSVS